MSEEVDLNSIEFPCDPSTLPTRSELPVGSVVLEIKNFTATTSSDETHNKIGIACQFGLAEPEALAGIPHTERFWIGTDDDPKGLKPATWKRNAVKLMKLFKESGVSIQPTSKVQELCAAAVGQRVGADTNMRASTKINPKTGKPYEPQLNLSYWKVGTKQVHLVEDDAALSQPFAAASQNGASSLSSTD